MKRFSGPAFPLREVTPQRETGRTIAEPAREIPVLAQCDVAVFGGGPAGVCAAAAAARHGAGVILVERQGFLGGMATAANVNLLHPLYGTDGATKTIGGLPEEFVRRLQALDAVRNSDQDGETGHWVFCSEKAKFVLDDMVLGGSARLLLHTALAGALADGRRVTAALVEGKSGREAIIANTYIDCTGDADLLRRLAAPTQLGDGSGLCQAPSLCVRVSGVQPDAASFGQVQAELFADRMDYNLEPYPTFLWGSVGVWDGSERMMAGTRVLKVNLADTLDLSRAEVEARYQLRWVLGKLKQIPGWQNAHLVDIATQIGPRETHRILADHQLTREDVLNGTPFPDAIAQGTYPIDIHCPDGPGISFEYLNGATRHIAGDGGVTTGRWDGRPEGAPERDTLCYQVPFGSLVPQGFENVLAAGRCIGATHHSAGAIRVMVNCMQFGQAAGTAAALTGADADVRSVTPRELREALLQDGVPLLSQAG